MSSLVVRNIGQLVTNQSVVGDRLGIIEGAALRIDEGIVTWVGEEPELPVNDVAVAELDAGGAAVVPGFVDSHTHAVFAGDRADEFALRLAGATYEELMAAGGGIASTVAATRAASAEQLYAVTRRRADEMLAGGTTTVEMKSGYGLDVATEVALLETIGRLGDDHGIEIVPTFLGAHLVPPEFQDRRDEYVALVIEEMLPVCAPRATYCDVFCDEGAFTLAETRAIMKQARELGLGLRMHADQLAATGAATLAAELGAVSADHLDHVSDESLAAMADAGTVAVLLPGVALSLRIPYPDVTRIMEAGVPVAIATDANPGTSYIVSMQLIVALATLEMKMSAADALWSATRGGALALGLDAHGSLAPGSVGDLVVLAAETYSSIAYRPGTNLAATVVKSGDVVVVSDG